MPAQAQARKHGADGRRPAPRVEGRRRHPAVALPHPSAQGPHDIYTSGSVNLGFRAQGFARCRQERAAATLAAGGLLEGAARGASALPPSDPALSRLDHVLSAACAGAAAAARPETLDPTFRTGTGLSAQGLGPLPSQSPPGAGSGRGDGAGGACAGRLGGPEPGAELAGEGARLWRAAAALAVLEAFQVGAAPALVAACPCLVPTMPAAKLPAGGRLALRRDACLLGGSQAGLPEIYPVAAGLLAAALRR